MLELLHPPRHGSVYLIGGGGKTTLMFRLALELAELGERVVTTTSTKILEPVGQGSLRVSSSMDELLRNLKLDNGERMTVAKRWVESTGDLGSEEKSRKLEGFSVDELDLLLQSRISTALIVEADGSAGRSLKAHAAHEPVVSSRADLVVVVVGVDCLGRPLDESAVHRPRLFAERLGLPMGTTILPEHVAAIVLHPEGYLAKVSPSSRVMVAITKVSSDDERETAARLSDAIGAMDTERRLVGVMVVGAIK